MPVAIATGGGFDDEQFKSMQDACKGVEGIQEVPWLRPDKSMPRPGQTAVNQSPQMAEGEDFARETAQRVKEALGKLKLGEGGQTGVFLF